LKNQLEKLSFFDYIIIGSGLSGLQLAMQMEDDIYFKNKKVAIFDKELKNTNDKTFCFWEQMNGKWDNCVDSSWNKTIFKNSKHHLEIDLNTYNYKKINSIDFYNYCKKKLSSSNTFSFFTEKVITVNEANNKAIVITETDKKYSCTHVFDSRLEKSIEAIKKETIYISQSFKGWVIKTTKPTFETDIFTMMDYSHTWKKSTSFMYILPKNSTEALFEYTFFAPFTIKNNEFDSQIKTYIDQNYPNIKYKITEIEQGVIPMTTYKFQKHNKSTLTKIGIAGGWAKASSGYSFKFAEKNSAAIVNQIKNNETPTGYKKSKRFYFYDKLLLKILAYDNNKGPSMFFDMYKKTDIKLLLRFLDEETSFFEEVKIISRLTPWPFLKALFTKIK